MFIFILLFTYNSKPPSFLTYYYIIISVAYVIITILLRTICYYMRYFFVVDCMMHFFSQTFYKMHLNCNIKEYTSFVDQSFLKRCNRLVIFKKPNFLYLFSLRNSVDHKCSPVFKHKIKKKESNILNHYRQENARNVFSKSFYLH